ncbi:MAG: AAA family ATPase [Firmicutes bacterium]|nr:AAA family ATPase [Bacillota bacterium]
MTIDRLISSEALIEAVNRGFEDGGSEERRTVSGRLVKTEAQAPTISRITLEGEDGRKTTLLTNKSADFWKDRLLSAGRIEIVYAPPRSKDAAAAIVSARLASIDEKIRRYSGGDMKIYNSLLSTVENMPSGKLTGLIRQEGSIGDHADTPEETAAAEFSVSSLEELKAKYAVLHSKYTAAQRCQIDSLIARFGDGDMDEKRRILKQLAFYVNFINGADKKVLAADPAQVRKGLDERFTGQDMLKDRLCRALAEYQQDPLHKAPRIAVTGRRGRDTERLIREFCGLCGMKHASFSCAGLYDVSPIVGSSTVYSNATVGSFAELLSSVGQGAMIVRDLDKVSGSDIIPAFQPLVSGHYKNDMLSSDVDTSSVWLFFTAEGPDWLTGLDTSELIMIESSEYSDEEMVLWADRWIRDFERDHGVPEGSVILSEEAKRDVALRYARKSSILNLKGIITEIMTSALPQAPVRIEKEDLPRYYGLLRRKDDIRTCRAQTVIGARDRFTLLRDEMDEGVAKRVSELLDDYETAPTEIRPAIEKLLLDLANLGCGRDEADLSRLSSVSRTVYGMKKPLEAIADQIFAHSRNPRVRLEPLLLCGPAGTGKTFLAETAAKMLGLPVVHIHFDQICCPVEITGIPGVRPGLLGRLCEKDVSSLSAVVIVDELDKPADPALFGALYNLFDKQTAYDSYYCCSYSTDELLFICTANEASAIPFPLLDRCRVMDVRSYSRRECLTIADEYISPRIMEELGCGARVPYGILELLVDRYAVGCGVRDLERGLEIIYKRAQRLEAKSGKAPVIDEAFVRDCLGDPRPLPEPAARDMSGTATALAVMGGGGIPIQIEVCPGQNNRKLVTGLARGSYLESVELACNVASRLLGREIDGIFVHSSPAGIEKEGPSAGAALLAAVVSYCTGIPLGDAAVTGELKAYGEIEAVGGINEKLRAAASAGVKKVYIPRKNWERARAEGLLEGCGVEVIPVGRAEELIGLLFPGITISDLRNERRNQ